MDRRSRQRSRCRGNTREVRVAPVIASTSLEASLVPSSTRMNGPVLPANWAVNHGSSMRAPSPGVSFCDTMDMPERTSGEENPIIIVIGPHSPGPVLSTTVTGALPSPWILYFPSVSTTEVSYRDCTSSTVPSCEMPAASRTLRRRKNSSLASTRSWVER